MGGIKKQDKGDKAALQQAKAQALAQQAKEAAESRAAAQSPPQGPEERTRRSCLHKQLRKTKFCMYHLQGVCQFQDNCAFAHSCVELQGAPDLRKTRLCKAFVNGNCKERNCSFAHSEEELRSTDLFYKKSLCMWYEKGRCRNGDQCRFAHGTAELRSRPVQPGPQPGEIPSAAPAGGAAGNGGSRRGGKNSAGHGGKSNGAGSAGAAAGGGAGSGDGNGGSGGAPTAFGATAAGVGLGEALGAGTFAGASGKLGAGGLTSGMPSPMPVPLPPGIGDRSSLEPMFVQTVPQLMALQDGIEQLNHQQRQMEQLQRASATSVDLESLRRYERQMEQLQNAYAGNRLEGARNASPTLEADLEKLTQNIAALSLQLSRFETQMQMRAGHPVLPGTPGAAGQALLQQASALATQSMLMGARTQNLCMEKNGSAANPYSFGNLMGMSMPQSGGLEHGAVLHA
mmetsp:Transcript_110963/g.309008  ORF Transcript_110963/g.309008 Transcript_110963/m.309008 type:complete len:456 (-) Transcript_110963:321-1688(-)